MDGGSSVGSRGVCEQRKENVVAKQSEVGSGFLGGRINVRQDDEGVDDSAIRGNEPIQLVVVRQIELR